ncbi:MAG TPA: 23S rRNA (adenine(2503)-C(2))-methyltransferase RlmN, partial [Bryobacteraceae bacterium]|nr:23S rRNA (adenine(2503)-C(2))-methyltransferase RlmN [Bryobacteraceae bacterium]
MSRALVGLELPDLEHVLGPDQPAYRARQLYAALYKQKVTDIRNISSFPAELRRSLASELHIGLPEVERFFDSADGTRRYLLRLEDGKTIETVLMPEGDRNTICISSQVGCPVDCKFCLTALMGLERHLTAGEIVGQVLLVCAAHGLTPDDSRLNLVMMGMGEPLLNLKNVLK